ncbi:exosortase/archaeosortase family protein [Caldilinea sp.]|uniref:exosortase/archaeosortase family protein n=1 Tax=Caldilinea sp. TaxID=2293560 RepID=UPI00261DEE4B|nr:exosortase/archaeosortase family protein [uncultured Caldilinea sp.]
MQRFDLRELWLPVAAMIGYALITWPVWQWLWFEWMSNEYYSHGLLIAPVALFLAIQRVRNDPQLRLRFANREGAGLLLLGATLAFYLYALQQRAYYLAAFAMIGMLAGAVWTLAGAAALRRLAFPIGYLALMVPLPVLDRITLPLALFTGYCSGALVQFLGLDVTITGNAVTLPNAELVIGAQCSGVNSLISLVALLTLVAYLLEGSVGARLLLTALALPLALLGNILRVAALLFVARAWGAEAGFTFYHDYSGVLFFLAMVALTLPLTRALRFGSLRPEVI